MEDFGFIMLSRKVFQSEMWEEERELSKFEAWLDLIATAAFADHERIVLGRFIHLKRGELVASVRYLATRWRWKKTSVDRFLHVLQDRSKIGTRNETGITIISLCNYERYNTPGLKSGTANGTRSGHARDTLGTKIIRERQIEGKEQNTPPNPLEGEQVRETPSNGFDQFWKAYPNKKSKGTACKVWTNAIKTTPAETIMSNLERVKAGYDWTKDGGRYIPHPATWLRAEGWYDEPSQPPQSTSFQLEHIPGDTL